MNIFFLSWVIEHCAQYHCSRHVLKMVIEYSQLLSIAHHVINPLQAQDWTDKGLIYKKTHPNHPCSIWVRECKENYIWLCHLGLALCKEYGYRYDKQPSDHKCYVKLLFLILNVPNLNSNGGYITLPRLAMPDQYKTNDVILSYRLYYLNEKARMLVWKKRSPPCWVPANLCLIHNESEQKRLIKVNKKAN